MQRENLTVERIKRFSCPTDKGQVFLWDDVVKRLAVRITSSGVKSFVFEGKLDRTTIRWTIGKTADWTIEDARKEARRLQTLIDRGVDPREQDRTRKAEKDAKKAAAETVKKYTFKALLEAYADHLEAQGKLKSAKAARSVIKVHVFDSDPTLASKSAVSITPYDVAALIRKVHEAGKERSAGILRSTISAAYNCGRRAPFDANLPSTFIEFSIVSNPVDVIPTIPVKARMRTLSPIELKKYIDALGEDTIDMALKLALFSSGQRMAQLLRAEISDWDADRKILRLFDPKGKRKQPREHLLPLGPIAASLVTSLIKKAEERGTRFLLPSSINAPLHDSMLGPRVKEIATAIGGDPFDGRDLRRTAETMLAGLGVSRDVRAQLLSHGISGVQQAHYDKYDYMREKHAALLKWERHLAKILTGDEDRKVIPFNNARRNER